MLETQLPRSDEEAPWRGWGLDWDDLITVVVIAAIINDRHHNHHHRRRRNHHHHHLHLNLNHASEYDNSDGDLYQSSNLNAHKGQRLSVIGLFLRTHIVTTNTSSQHDTVTPWKQSSGKPRTFLNTCETVEKMQYDTIQYDTIQYNTIQYNTIRYKTISYTEVNMIIITSSGLIIMDNHSQYMIYVVTQYNTTQYNTIVCLSSSPSSSSSQETLHIFSELDTRYLQFIQVVHYSSHCGGSNNALNNACSRFFRGSNEWNVCVWNVKSMFFNCSIKCCEGNIMIMMMMMMTMMMMMMMVVMVMMVMTTIMMVDIAWNNFLNEITKLFWNGVNRQSHDNDT